MKQKSPGSTSKGIGETRIALKQIGQANDILRNQQGHEHFSHIDLAMYNVTRDAMHEENDENAPPIDPQIAFELGLPPKADGKRNTKNYFGNPEKATNAGNKTQTQTQWILCATPNDARLGNQGTNRISKSACYDVIHYCCHRWEYCRDDNNSY